MSHRAQSCGLTIDVDEASRSWWRLAESAFGEPTTVTTVPDIVVSAEPSSARSSSRNREDVPNLLPTFDVFAMSSRHEGLRVRSSRHGVRHTGGREGRGWYTECVGAFIATTAVGDKPLQGTLRDAVLVGLGQVAGGSDQADFARAHARLLAEVGS